MPRYTSRRLMSGRRTYTRRTGRYYGRRRGFLPTGRIGKSHVSACAAVYHNPFSTATTNPKLPDGKVYASTGIRLQSVAEFANDSTENMDILLFPGLNNGCAITSVGSGGATTQSLPYRDHGMFNSGALPQGQLGASIHKWRIVSQALKITLVNNSDENDGWFEAIRVQGSADSGFGPQTQEDGIPPGVYVSSAVSGVLPAVAANNMVEHPTYVTGKLRDIHRYMFHLMPQGNDHEFNIMPRTVETDEEFVQSCLDNESYDSVFIRVHGRAGASPTRLMLHVISNQEVVYDEGSFMTRYHSEARGNMAAMARIKASRQNNPANTTAALIPMARLQQARWG